MWSLSLPVLSYLLLCFVFSPSASPFSFVAMQDRHFRHGKHYRQLPLSPAIGRSIATARYSFLPNDRGNERAQDTNFPNNGDDPNDQVTMQSRRRMASFIVAGYLTSGVVTHHLKHAFAANANAAMIDTPASIGAADHPVVIIGGGGRTGMAVAEAVADPGLGNMHAITLSRSGRDPFQIVKLPEATKKHLKHRDEPFDVREPEEAISASLRALSPSVVVYAASASRQGGNAFEVDDVGVEKVALACKDLGAIFVLISALAVDRPDSKSYQITNTLGGNYQGIMDAKYNGEAKTRKIFSSGKSDYVILRPGVLLNGKTTTGPVGLELNQGDTIGGGLSRDELAGIVVGAIQSRALARAIKPQKKGEGITVEVYRKSTAQTLEKKFLSLSGNELTVDASKVSSSSTTTLYRELFTSAKVD